VRDDRVFLLGHPYMQRGPVTLPLATAEIVGVLPSRLFSFKLGSMGTVVGAVYHDLRAGLSGRLGAGPALVPVQVSVVRGGERERYEFEVVRDPQLTPTLVFWCLYNSLLIHGDDLSLQTIGYEIDTRWRHGDETAAAAEPVRLSGAVAGPRGAFALGPEFMAPLQILMANRHEALTLDRVAATFEVSRPMRTAAIASVEARRLVRPGETLTLGVTLQPRLAAPQKVNLALPLPAHLPPGRYRLLVATARDLFALEAERAAARFADRSLPATLDLIRTPRSTTELVAALYASRRTVVVDGRELAGLPGSVAGLLGRDSTGRVTPTLAGLVSSVRHEAGQVLHGHVVVDVIVPPPAAPTSRKDTRP
jgi:hypothetical protein